MSGFNQVIVLGRLAAQPEQLLTKQGKMFLKAGIAVTVYRKGADGVNAEYTDFIPATIFGKTAETFLKFVRKGDMVHLSGRLQGNEWKREEPPASRSLSWSNS